MPDNDDDDDDDDDEPLVMMHSLYDKKKDETVYEIVPLSPETDIAHNKNNNLELNADLSDSTTMSISSNTHAISANVRLVIKFAFVTIMIFICLNVLFCIFLSLRHSGALDKYFEELPDADEEENEFMSDADEDEVHLQILMDGDADVDIDDEDDINDEQALFDCAASLQPSKSLCVAIEPGCPDYEEEEQKKLRIYISELQDDQSDLDVNTPFKE